jgi:hypothetical protein
MNIELNTIQVVGHYLVLAGVALYLVGYLVGRMD